MEFYAAGKSSPVHALEGFGNDRIKVNSRYLTKDDKPWIPVMGECHYSRVPREKWKETLRKMKEGGIEVVASYVFWIHHEEEKGRFDFRGNRDIRAFIELCHEQDLEFCLRIGPWAHGECRNGGFPDWLCRECADSLRSTKEPYFGYAKRYIEAVADQVRGLELFGIQIENEMTHRPAYLEELRRLVVSAGLTAPLFTATGWGNAKLPDTLIPMYGGYPEAPWTGHVHELEPNANYFFSHVREDGNIGSDLLSAAEGKGHTEAPDSAFPFLTCELGGGNQSTYHRRPRITSGDIEALAVCKLGSGANLLGYYMYAGGVNPVGKTTMQESKATGYPNDCPVISYDFQAPIGDMGQLRESRFRLERIHRFLRAFGELLAPMTAVMPNEMPTSLADTETLRCALRTDGKGGFLFVNNHIRLKKLPEKKSCPFTFRFAEETVSFEMDVPADSCFFIPVNLTLAGLKIRCAFAQPTDQSGNTLTLQEIPGLEPIVLLGDGGTVRLEAGDNRIGETVIRFLPFVPYTPTALTPTPVAAERVTSTCPSALLMEHLPMGDRTVEYAVRWTENDRWMVIRAKGSVAGFYADGVLVNDSYPDGLPWVIDLRQLKAKEGIVKIQPLTDEDRGTMYLEIPFESGVFAPEVFVSGEDVLRI